MLALLARRNFLLLWVAHTISIVGDYVFFIAITFWIYEQTGSASATGGVLIASAVPAFLFAPLAGIVVDRWDRKRLMFVAESARGLLFLGLLGMVAIQPHALWAIYVVGFVQSALAAFFWPARSALLPQLIQPDALLAANALYLVSDSVVRVLAPSLSTFALLHSGPAGVIVLDAASFVISAGCIRLLTLPAGRQMGSISSPEKKLPSIVSAEPQVRTLPLQCPDVSEKHTPWLRPKGIVTSGVGGPLLLGALVAYIAGTLSILFPVLVRSTLSAGALAYGWMFAAQAIGEGGMSVLLGRTRLRPGRVKGIGFVSGSLALGGLSLILMASFHTLVSSLLLNVLFGAMVAATSVHLLTLLQQRIADRVLGRALATYSAAQALAQVGGMGVAAITVDRIGVLWLLALDGIFFLLGSGFAWICLRMSDSPGSGATKNDGAE